MKSRADILRMTACAAFAVALTCAAASAQQQQQSVPNALQGFSQNKDKPVQIEAASLEVRDKDKVATFSGNVVVTQGDTTMRCKSLLVYYDTEGKSSGGMKAAQPGPGGSSSIKKLEAKGGVHVTQKDQTATGAEGLFDMKTNSITLSGNVLITQGQNILRGERLVVDMATGAARVEGGRVSGVFMPGGSDSKDKDKDKDKEKDAAKDKEPAKSKDKNAGKPRATKEADKDDATPATVSAPAPIRPAVRNSDAVSESAPAAQQRTAPDRGKPVAPRGIY